MRSQKWDDRVLMLGVEMGEMMVRAGEGLTRNGHRVTARVASWAARREQLRDPDAYSSRVRVGAMLDDIRTVTGSREPFLTPFRADTFWSDGRHEMKSWPQSYDPRGLGEGS